MLLRFLEKPECSASHLQKKYVILHYYISAGSWWITSNFMSVKKCLHNVFHPTKGRFIFTQQNMSLFLIALPWKLLGQWLCRSTYSYIQTLYTVVFTKKHEYILGFHIPLHGYYSLSADSRGRWSEYAETFTKHKMLMRFVT
jgi:hypothetical protein